MELNSPPDPNEHNHRATVAAAMAGDEFAFAQLYQRYGNGLGRYFSTRFGNGNPVVEDLVQETWVAVYLALKAQKYDVTRAQFSTYVYAIARNVWLRQRRASGNDGLRVVGDLELTEDLPSWLLDVTDATDAMHAAELLDAMRNCLATTGSGFSLTSEERSLLVSLAGGESERALAAQLDVSASTIHARKRAAYGKLRRCLRGKGFSEDSFERWEQRHE